jgi:hypothetical protein
MWFLLPIAALAGFMGMSKFKKAGGAEGLVRKAIVSEVKDRAKHVYDQVLQAGHAPKKALAHAIVEAKKFEARAVHNVKVMEARALGEMGKLRKKVGL